MVSQKVVTTHCTLDVIIKTPASKVITYKLEPVLQSIYYCSQSKKCISIQQMDSPVKHSQWEEQTYPSISIIRFRISNSEAPGNNGNPKNNSATIHPKDHISIAAVYLKDELSIKPSYPDTSRLKM